MISLSRRRKDSSTAFLIHWCTVHWPTASRVATRRRPLFELGNHMLDGIAHFFGGGAGERLARLSQAVVDGALELLGHGC
jgi:hypothetical protein